MILIKKNVSFGFFLIKNKKKHNIPHMDINEYMKKFELNRVQFASLVELPVSSINHYVRGERMPTLENALKIHKATKGKVKLESLIDSYYSMN